MLNHVSLQVAPGSSADTTADSVRAQVRAWTGDDPTYWDFSGTKRNGAHAFFQYPAMMVPELQGRLLDVVRTADPNANVVYDPFMGSGTVLLECAYRGISFHGADINPMAVLVSQVKANAPTIAAATRAATSVLADAHASREDVLHDFSYRDKWFNSATALQLTKLRSAIRSIERASVRRFMWLCLSETVRLVSNSRLSTFKLHSYSPAVLAKRSPDALSSFAHVTATNILRLKTHIDQMPVSAERGRITAVCRDVNDRWAHRTPADVLMTSPPYGDNHTTIPYGQHSYLPLNWIEPSDLPALDTAVHLASTLAIDTMSLGGSRRLASRTSQSPKPTLSPSMDQFVDGLASRPSLYSKATNFYRDYARALASSESRLRPGGLSLWTLGERRIGGAEMPLVAGTREILESLGHAHVETLTRRLPINKRISARNDSGSTMQTETVLIMQKRMTSP